MADAIPDSAHPNDVLPLTLASSMILTQLPPSTTTALTVASQTSNPPSVKITVRFVPVGSAPSLRQPICKISSAQRFEQVVSYLRRTLRVGPEESMFLYIGSSFAPALDEVVGNLHRVSRAFISCYGRERRKERDE
ncbi:ubiquitin-like autophagy protein Apg12-domain-containing protein [Calycina marina]|uniref:Ubiquitin-like protein ATG12 n=1 Tax=Calycina marina TaxID=1763456 RepID=A0A9P7Z7F1_9HELO|nr:ubiquitin-like autophagy protein Apg12-domain-containing protein [Calycina marina]